MVSVRVSTTAEILKLFSAEKIILGRLSKTRRQQQRERYKIKDLMSRIAVHVRYNSLYIS